MVCVYNGLETCGKWVLTERKGTVRVRPNTNRSGKTSHTYIDDPSPHIPIPRVTKACGFDKRLSSQLFLSTIAPSPPQEPSPEKITGPDVFSGTGMGPIYGLLRTEEGWDIRENRRGKGRNGGLLEDTGTRLHPFPLPRGRGDPTLVLTQTGGWGYFIRMDTSLIPR